MRGRRRGGRGEDGCAGLMCIALACTMTSAHANRSRGKAIEGLPASVCKEELKNAEHEGQRYPKEGREEMLSTSHSPPTSEPVLLLTERPAF
jgi:hypothetical protein